jgi:hypothetical protein
MARAKGTMGWMWPSPAGLVNRTRMAGGRYYRPAVRDD